MSPSTDTVAFGPWHRAPLAVLVSGGPDSAVLVGELALISPQVTPLYVRFGMVWEPAEERALRRFLAAISSPTLAALQVFDLPLAAVYGDHWSTTGEQTPGSDTPDSAVFLPGRNLLLLAQTSVWCHLHAIGTLALGLLRGNPFSDATDRFFADYQATIQQALGSGLQIVRPYQALSKTDVLRRGAAMPLEETWSCIRPVGDLHCGRCNKCAERHLAFVRANFIDPTRYAPQGS
jgi:7-cyano-7-deazaguanine synthase